MPSKCSNIIHSTVSQVGHEKADWPWRPYQNHSIFPLICRVCVQICLWPPFLDFGSWRENRKFSPPEEKATSAFSRVDVALVFGLSKYSCGFGFPPHPLSQSRMLWRHTHTHSVRRIKDHQHQQHQSIPQPPFYLPLKKASLMVCCGRRSRNIYKYSLPVLSRNQSCSCCYWFWTRVQRLAVDRSTNWAVLVDKVISAIHTGIAT